LCKEILEVASGGGLGEKNKSKRRSVAGRAENARDVKKGGGAKADYRSKWWPGGRGECCKWDSCTRGTSNNNNLSEAGPNLETEFKS